MDCGVNRGSAAPSGNMLPGHHRIISHLIQKPNVTWAVAPTYSDFYAALQHLPTSVWAIFDSVLSLRELYFADPSRYVPWLSSTLRQERSDIVD